MHASKLHCPTTQSWIRVLSMQNLIVPANVTVSMMTPVAIVFVTLWHRRQITEMRLKAMLDLASGAPDCCRRLPGSASC
jgi:hypothetical protein